MKFKRFLALLLTLLLLFSTTACAFDVPQPTETQAPTTATTSPEETPPTQTLAEPAPSEQEEAPSLPVAGEYYYDVTNVVLYLELYGELPGNFITKAEARELGWNGGSVEDYKAGGAIGGDYFGNYEELLPKADGRTYHECDIDTNGASGRGAKRVVFSSDGLYFYTSDHYASFTQVFVTEDYEVIW